MTTVRVAARRELSRGRRPIPIPVAHKQPNIKGWQHLFLTTDDLEAKFGEISNLGILNGAPSGNQVDVDLDCIEALLLADQLLPATDAVFGRQSKCRSHRLYICNPLPSTIQFRDTDGSMLLELRSTGTQTLFPPSLHPSGEAINWDCDGSATQIEGDLLTAAVATTAAACILARHWPDEGARQDAALALTGGLHRLGWLEDDVAAFVTSVAQAAGDEEPSSRATAAGYSRRRLVEGGPATGWPRLASFLGDDVVVRAKAWLGAPGCENSDPTEVPWEPPVELVAGPRPPFPTDIFPDWLQAYVEAVAVATQTPRALAGMLVLSCLATACAKKFVVHLNADWHEPINIFTVTAMPPAERKSAVFTEVTRPIVEFEATEVARLAPQIAEAQGRHKIAEQVLGRAQKDAALANASERAALVARADELARELAMVDTPVAPRLIADDCTPERLSSMLAEQGGRIAIMAPEGDVFDLMSGRYGTNGAPNFGVYLKGHAGDDLRVDRVGRRGEYVHAPAITVGLAVQPEVVHGFTTRSGFRGRGLLGRFLYAIPESLLGRRDIDPPVVPVHARNRYHQNLTALLLMRPSTDQKEEGVPEPHRLVLTVAARRNFRSFQAELEPRLGDLRDLEHLRDWAGKLAGAVARIAGLLHLAEYADLKTPWDESISDTTVAAAIRLAQDFLIPHAFVAFAQMGVDPADADARYVLRVLVDRECDTFTKRDLFQLVKGRFKAMGPFERALAVLEEHSYIRPQPEIDRPGPGRKPSPKFDVNPLWRAERIRMERHPWAEECIESASGSRAPESPQIAHNAQNASDWHGELYCEDSEHSEASTVHREIMEWAIPW